VFLDATVAVGAAMRQRFPTVAAACLAAGIDPATQPMPIRPAAHYHMGGISVDSRCRASISGLWACGEAAGTGLHGANRLASNSLLEAVVTGVAVAEDLGGASLPALRALRDARSLPEPQAVAEIRAIMSGEVGVLRDAVGLDRALQQLSALIRTSAPHDAPLAAFAIALAASRRKESRGAHFRKDFPERQAAAGHRQELRMADIQDAIRAYAP
jgi:L-aspartate oxidase